MRKKKHEKPRTRKKNKNQETTRINTHKRSERFAAAEEKSQSQYSTERREQPQNWSNIETSFGESEHTPRFKTPALRAGQYSYQRSAYAWTPTAYEWTFKGWKTWSESSCSSTKHDFLLFREIAISINLMKRYLLSRMKENMHFLPNQPACPRDSCKATKLLI